MLSAILCSLARLFCQEWAYVHGVLGVGLAQVSSKVDRSHENVNLEHDTSRALLHPVS
jgi:hypothetical protein